MRLIPFAFRASRSASATRSPAFTRSPGCTWEMKHSPFKETVSSPKWTSTSSPSSLWNP